MRHTLNFFGSINGSSVLDLVAALAVAACCFHLEAAEKLFICLHLENIWALWVLSEDDDKTDAFHSHFFFFFLVAFRDHILF